MVKCIRFHQLLKIVSVPFLKIPNALYPETSTRNDSERKGNTDYLCLQNKSKEAIACKEPLRIIRNIAAEKVEYESLRFLECTMLT